MCMSGAAVCRQWRAGCRRCGKIFSLFLQLCFNFILTLHYVGVCGRFCNTPGNCCGACRVQPLRHCLNLNCLYMKNIFIIMFSALLLLSCSDNRKYVIAVSQCSEDNWRDKLYNELVGGTYLYNDIDMRYVSARDDDKTQIAQIDSFIKMGVDLLIVSPNQMNTVTAAIDRAYDNGIPVILFDRKTDSEKYTAFIGGDNYEVGQAMGRYILSQAKGESLNVVEIQGLRGSSPTIERHRGFMDAVKGQPGINIVASCYGGWLYEEGYRRMDSILAVRSDIDCVFGHNDRMAMGARKAVEDRGLNRDIMYMGVDALASKGGGMTAVRDGELTASYLYPTRGDLVLQLAVNILEGKAYERDNYLKAAIVTKDNAVQMLMQNDEMASQTDRLKMAHMKVDSYLTQYNHQKIYLVLVVTILLLCLILFIHVYRTIVQKRRIAEEAADLKLQFFTNVSHELRTPLTLIADPVDRLLADEGLSKEQRAMLGMVHKNVKVLLRLVTEILDFRKIQKGKMVLRPSVFCLSDSLRDWAGCFAAVTGKKNVALTIHAGDGIMLTADKEKIESIVYNLISNAIKYTPSGGSVDVSAASSGGTVVIKVADTGIGIPRDSLQKVFDRFFQVGGRSVAGTGVGLAIVKSFAELHGGSVAVESREGSGSVFTVTVPCKCSAPEEDISDVAQTSEKAEYAVRGLTVDDAARSDRARLAGVLGDKADAMSILVVDDNEDVRGYIASVVGADYSVIEAADGAEGLEKAVKHVPDLIICDVMMPVMDGMEMCRRVKAETATSHIPVLMLTAMAQDGQRAEGYDCGADAYLTKPFSSKLLLARIRNLLENRSRLRAIYSSGSYPEEKPATADNAFIKALREKINRYIDDSDFNVEQLSSEMGLSRVQLYRKVKALVDITPVEMIRIMRLQRAEQLLKAGGKTVAEVSYEVGFSSPSYFSKCFKEHFGKLPGDVAAP